MEQTLTRPQQSLHFDQRFDWWFAAVGWKFAFVIFSRQTGTLFLIKFVFVFLYFFILLLLTGLI